ncbi:hypothetical protein UFOVP1361_16 [uncultured Caudovirales phage]|uniref:Uncharacterized protein n=1 Tax=uncultured Caudovirales phage TaxID=2100421 RepID=A0A6J5RUB3_9CAUD|nr:hypothetical protein UFOVP1361_16 [uncultured Caudovirales phage]
MIKDFITTKERMDSLRSTTKKEVESVSTK